MNAARRRRRRRADKMTGQQPDTSTYIHNTKPVSFPHLTAAFEQKCLSLARSDYNILKNPLFSVLYDCV